MVLQTVQGMKLEFEESPLQGQCSGFEIPENQPLIQEEVNKLLKKGVVVECDHEPVEYISPIFLKEKTDGTQRLILNLKKLNKHLEYKQFKMQTLQTILTLIQPNCYMATIDLKDAYYSVKSDGGDTCFLKFLCNSKLLKFVVLANGLSQSPRKFTKLTKPPLAMLRMQGYTVAIYIDDIIAIDQSFEECLLTVVETINLFKKLGFVIHPHKSKFIPAKIVEYLGFIIDSEKMITYLSDQKKQKIYEKCCIIPMKRKLTIREFASFIGTLTSSFPGKQFGPLYYRAMLKFKDKSLKYNKGNFNAGIKLSEDTLHEISWWKKNIFKVFKPMRYPKFSITVYIDASLEGWGASMGNVSTGGAWLPDEKLMHINVLELKAILLALNSFVKTNHEHIKIMSDNTTAIHCINKMGTSHSMECHHQVLKNWEWTIIHKNHLSAAHVPGKLNTVADKESRSNHVDTEWMLQPKVLNLALEHLSFKPEIDLFATNINTQFGKYAAFRPDPGAMYIDAFSIDWFDLKFYAFPPISVIPRVLSKVKQDSAEGIIVVPFWPTQVWYPAMLKMLVSTPLLLNSWKSLLVRPQTPNQVHPMWKKMSMLVVHLSGSLQKANHCQEMLLKSYQLRGEREQEKGTTPMSKGLSSFVVIPFKQLLR